jgi:Escherichia/Staphylococcus phage prohead protease
VNAAALTTKSLSFAIKAVEETAGLGRFTAIANAFNEIDSYGDRTVRGCFAASIAARPTIPLLWAHSPGEPIGLVRNMRESARGLEFSGTIIRAIARGEEAWQLLRGVDGIPVLKFSIGYDAVVTSQERDARVLKQVALYEISVVSMPANEGSILISIEDAGKSLDAALAKMRATIADIKRSMR